MTEPSDLDLTTASEGFQLVSPYQPAGDQPQAIEKLVAGFQNGVAKQVLLGVCPSVHQWGQPWSLLRPASYCRRWPEGPPGQLFR